MAQVVQFPAQSDMAKAVQTDNTNLTNLGSQIKQVMEQYKQLHQQIMASPQARNALSPLLDQRFRTIQALIEAHRNAELELRQKAAQNNIAIDAQLPSVTLQGLGQLVDTSSIQTTITDEQSKLTALQTYFTDYQQAVDAGQQPPPLPAELASGAFGMGTGTIIALVGLAVGAWAFFKGK